MLMNSVPKVCRLVSYNSRNYLFGQKYKEITNYSYNYLSIDKHHYCNKSEQLINYSQKAANKMSNTPSSSATTAKQDDAVHKHVNRLANEKSPYLLQHAHNPVDWYPWCDEAIERSKAENKLIFLSVGYSTCHWCHVMETESFEDENIAKILNENFINIKVDREERPDIDKIYMNYVVTLNGSGGWPMSVWLTPNLVPVTSGTYFPPNDRWGMPSFKTVLLKIIEHWKNLTPDQTEQLQSIFDTLLKHSLRQIKPDSSATSGGASSCGSQENFEIEEKFRQAMNLYKANLDKTWGGFSKKGPKFPEVSKLLLLLHGQIQQSNQNILPVVIETLNKISNGGIHDHIFGGFARYSVDEKWHVPHFEKMLYDQGQLLMAYSIAYKITRNPKYLMVADKIFQYCNKDLKNTNGGFYSGEDADSYPNEQSKKKIEGAFYAWTWSEIRNCCDDNKAALLSIAKNAFDIYCSYYGVTETGNVQPASDPHGHLTAKNILMITNDVEDIVKEYDVTTDEIEKIIELVNDKLHEIRERRPRPHLDTKIITSWNGLLMSGLSKLACCKESKNKNAYLEAAEKQMQFIKKHLYDPKTHTLLRSCYGESIESNEISVLSIPIKGFLDDYAFLIKGLLDYYIVTMDLDLLYWAKELQNTQDQLFWDPESGGYYYSQENAQIGRLKDDHDGAEPCGNSISANNLLLLSGYFEDKNYREKVKKIYEFYKDSKPFGYVFPEMLSSMLLYDNGLTMIVVVGPTENTETNDLLNCIREFYIPGLLLIHLDPENIDKITRPSAAHFKSVNDQPTVYLCQNKVCQLPITSCEKLHESLSLKYIFK